VKSHANCLMGIDLGSSSCKVVVIDERGRLLATGQEPCPPRFPRPGWVEQDAEAWYHACVYAIRRCLADGAIDPSRISALSVCGVAHSAALLDEHDRPIRPVIMWGDARGAAQTRWLQQEHGDAILDISFQAVHASWTLAQLLWVRQNEPEVWRRLRRVLLCKDYIVYRLTGAWQTDGYDAIGTQMLDVRSGQWSAVLADMIGLPLGCLPPIRPATAVAGQVTARAAEETGLWPGTMVAVGSGDSVVEALGVGVVEIGQCIVKLATSGTVSVVTAEAKPRRQVMTYCHVVPQRWFTIAATNYGASAANWFSKSLLGQAQGSDADSMDALAALAPPGSEGLIFHPYLQGERTPYWDPYLRGDFLGITARHQKPHFARAVLEGVSFALRDCLDALRAMNLTTSSFYLLGGGARSPLWQQITADILGVELNVPVGDAAAHGAALLAGVAVDQYASLEQGVSLALPTVTHVRPNEDTQTIYADLHAIYRQTKEALTNMYHELSRLYIGGDAEPTQPPTPAKDT
jgi:xylulokinase